MHTIITNLKQLVASKGDLNETIIKSHIKEYLQNYVLDFIYESEKYKDLIFYGGTCLRKVYNIDRMSEDLDFESDMPFNHQMFAEDIEKHFHTRLMYTDILVKVQVSEHISRVTIKFPILKELGLSGYDSEAIHIKVEVNSDTNTDYETILTPLSISNFTIFIKHYDLPTLMSGKILACLERTYKKGNTGVLIKGRDFYDLLWYMKQEIVPNEAKLLDHKTPYTTLDALGQLDHKIALIKSTDLLSDLEPFFEKQQYIKTWCENFHQLYSTYSMFYR